MYKEEEVRRGIALLDEKAPGWREKFNPEGLLMASSLHCTLGQTFGSYGKGLLELGLIGAGVADSFGFSLYYELMVNYVSIPDNNAYIRLYTCLGETWKALVPQTARKEVHVLEPERELVLA